MPSVIRGDDNFDSATAQVKALEVVTSGSFNTATASVDFTNLNFSSYDYILEYRSFIPSSNGALLIIQYSNNNGASYDTGANYSFATGTVTSAGTYGDVGSQGETYIRLVFSGPSSTYSRGGTSGDLLLARNYDSQYLRATFQNYTYRSDSYRAVSWGGGDNFSLANVNAFRILAHTGNIANMGYTLYRRTKS